MSQDPRRLRFIACGPRIKYPGGGVDVMNAPEQLVLQQTSESTQVFLKDNLFSGAAVNLISRDVGWD